MYTYYSIRDNITRETRRYLLLTDLNITFESVNCHFFLLLQKRCWNRLHAMQYPCDTGRLTYSLERTLTVTIAPPVDYSCTIQCTPGNGRFWRFDVRSATREYRVSTIVYGLMCEGRKITRWVCGNSRRKLRGDTCTACVASAPWLRMTARRHCLERRRAQSLLCFVRGPEPGEGLGRNPTNFESVTRRRACFAVQT